MKLLKEIEPRKARALLATTVASLGILTAVAASTLDKDTNRINSGCADITEPFTPSVRPFPKGANIPLKTDTDTTPAGVPGQNRGTPDTAGEGPACQEPGPDGYLPSEDRPAIPGEVQTGIDTHSGEEPVPAIGSERPTPTTDVVIVPFGSPDGK